MKIKQKGYSYLLLLFITTFIVLEIVLINSNLAHKGLVSDVQNNYSKTAKDIVTKASIEQIIHLSTQTIKTNQDLSLLSKDLDNTDLTILDNNFQQVEKDFANY